MARLTDDPNDPDLGHGADEVPVQQSKAYLVLSEEERAKGFVRPVRQVYRHVGTQPKHPLRDLTETEKRHYDRYGYVKFEEYPKGSKERELAVGRFWTQRQLDNRGCGVVTNMSLALAETYAREPGFYGTTYCVGCQMHRPVEEFVWVPDGSVVGS